MSQEVESKKFREYLERKGMRQLPIPIKSIEAILQYNWRDEEDDYNDHDREEGHIFTHLQRVSLWLTLIKKQGEQNNAR